MLEELIDAVREALGQWESGEPIHPRTAERLSVMGTNASKVSGVAVPELLPLLFAIAIVERATGPGGEDGGRSQSGDPPGA